MLSRKTPDVFTTTAGRCFFAQVLQGRRLVVPFLFFIAVYGRTDYEIDQEHTHGSVTFTELEYENASMDGMHADEHYLFVEDKLVAFRICFENNVVTFDSVVADLAKMYGEASEPDLAVLANGIYAVDDDGKLEGRALAITSGNMMIVIEEDEDEVEVTYIDLTAAYILAA